MVSGLTSKRIVNGGFNPDVDCMINDGDTAWVTVSSILVLAMMSALAFFEAGLSRKKETLTIFSQIWIGLAVLAVAWILFGYTLVFGPTQGGIIGGLDYIAFIGVDLNKCSQHALSIPHASFAIFQMMFACITPLLMTGAFAERLKWKAYIAFILIWEFLVYYPVAHIIWGGGFLSHKPLDTLDFAGGIVIHVQSGVAALVCAFVFGRRKDFDDHHGEPHPSNLPLAAIGAALLWMGWFGFNAGSALSSSSVAIAAIVNTQAAACTSTVVWLIMHWIKHKKPSLVSLLNGSIAGLAGITPASGYITVHAALVLGLILGAFSYLGIYMLKHKLRIDDALDVSSVHGITGLIGSIAIGFCATTSVNPDGADGVFYGNGWQLMAQLAGVGLAFFWSGLITFILAISIRMINRYYPHLLVNTREEEEQGLDALEFTEVSAYEETVSRDALELMLADLEKRRLYHMKKMIDSQQEQFVLEQKQRKQLVNNVRVDVGSPTGSFHSNYGTGSHSQQH